MEKRRPQDSVASRIQYMGLMMKRGAFRKNWTLRWFEITDKYLTYFKFDKTNRSAGYAAKVKGVIQLSDCLNVYRGKDRIQHATGSSVTWPEVLYPPARDSNTALALKTRSRVYFLVAPSKKAAKCWESHLRAVCAEVKPSFASTPHEVCKLKRCHSEMIQNSSHSCNIPLFSKVSTYSMVHVL